MPDLRLADPETRERLHVPPAGREDRLDGLLRVLHARLLGEHDVLEEGVNPAVDDLRDRLLRLALLAGDLLGDPALLLDQLGRHLGTGDVLGRRRRDLLREVLGDRLVGRVELDEHAEGRRQVPVGAVQVGGHVAAVEAGVPAELDLLLDRGAGLLDEQLDGPAVGRLGGEGREPVGDLVRQGSLRDLSRQLLELLVLGHEVGLAVQLDQDARVVAVKLGGDEAVAGRAVGPLAGVLDALLAQILDGKLEVATGLGQGVLAVHHPGAGLLPQPLHVSGGDIRHVCSFLARQWLSTLSVSVRPTYSGRSYSASAVSAAAVSAAAVSPPPAPPASSVAASAASGVVSAAAAAAISALSGATSAISASASAGSLTADSWTSSVSVAAASAGPPASRSRSHSGSGSSTAPVAE